MDKTFLELIMEKTAFPKEAAEELSRCFGVISENYSEQFLSAVEKVKADSFDTENTAEAVAQLAEISGIHIHTVWLLVIIQCAKTVREEYSSRGIDEQIYWDTMTDLRYKLMECKDVHGVWGNASPNWFKTFFTCDIFKLGRLEFQNCPYYFDVPYTFGDIKLFKGCDLPVKAIHIPAAPESFGHEARMDAYRKAYEFFRPQLNGAPLVCTCSSWLLYPEYKKILPSTSNIVSFMEDFDIIDINPQEKFLDAWRIFGADHGKPTEELPEKTSMQRIFKQHLLNGGKIGRACGVLIFDGEKIINI
ncbi:MAG: DUF5596 domain-containing protein [Oscillospiraceae bacterium]|nr:DUF5596 domain-containing protein [Oscillospiraceae bacterium]